jgi:hypothetical protein
MLPNSVPTKYKKPSVSTISHWWYLSGEYPREFSKYSKWRSGVKEWPCTLGKLIHEKKPEVKNLVTLSLYKRDKKTKFYLFIQIAQVLII